jgi:hypothetical protein
MNTNIEDIKQQAQWEVELETFENLVEVEKRRLREKKSMFPWRLKFINVDKEKANAYKY